MPDAPPDPLRRLAAGEAAALGEVIDRFAGPLGRTLARLAVPGGPAAEDLLQETFVRVWRKADTFDGRAEASTWVFTIALNVARDAARRRAVRTRADRRASRANGRAAAPAAAAECEAGDARGAVRRAVAALPDDLREPLVLRHFGGLTAAEAGRVLGLPPGTVKDRCARAVAALKPALARAGLDPRDDR